MVNEVKDSKINIEDILKKISSEFQQTNILITGKTGVGKSTLINSLFGEDLAKTGAGKPCTDNIKEYSRPNYPIHLIDTRGLELECYEEISNDIVNLVQERKKNVDPQKHIHIVWYCINNQSNRIEEGEIKFIKKISKDIPVIVVLTQSISNSNTFAQEIENVLYAETEVIKVLAAKFEISNDITIPPSGLEDLIDKTNAYIPEAQQKAFTAAQIYDIPRKSKAAENWVVGCTISAMAVGATPIPLSDAVALAPIQITMFSGISCEMGLSFNTAFLTTLFTSSIQIAGASIVGKTIVRTILKMIPGVSAVGGAISAATAGCLTAYIGLSYIATLEKLLKEGKEVTPENLKKLFKDTLKETEDDLSGFMKEAKKIIKEEKSLNPKEISKSIVESIAVKCLNQ